MTRRTFLCGLTLGTLTAPLAAEAQQAVKIPRLGYLSPTSAPAFENAFRQRLRELGYVEGRNIAIEYRWAEGKYERLPELAAELVRLRVEVILAVSNAAVHAAKSVTRTIPIVFTLVTDPVASGYIASLAAHPIRVGDQLEDCAHPRADDPALAAGAGGRSDRVARARPTPPNAGDSSAEEGGGSRAAVLRAGKNELLVRVGRRSRPRVRSPRGL